MSPSLLSRRKFIQLTAAGLAANQSRAEPEGLWPVIGFSKPFQRATHERTAEIVAQIGWQGIELPLRPKGQIEPEKVADELPALAAVLKARGLHIGLITTDIVSPGTPHAEKVLRAAKALGITRYRMGFLRYKETESPRAQLDALKPQMRDLAAMNREIGVQGGLQNHSGAGYVGCAVWDIFELVRDLNPAELGICFDIGHATLEGGTSWPLEARLMEPWFTCVYIKDFAWERGAKGFTSKWGPLGEGMVRREFLSWLKKSSYRGPISQHVEYFDGDTPEHLAQMKKDYAVLRDWLRTA